MELSNFWNLSLHTFFGKFVGKDNSGNKYYQNNKGKRWVIYNGEINASKIESDWYQWMHYQTDTNPSKVKVSKHSWQNHILITKQELKKHTDQIK